MTAAKHKRLVRVAVVRECCECPSVNPARPEPGTLAWCGCGDLAKDLPVSAVGVPGVRGRIPAWCPLKKVVL